MVHQRIQLSGPLGYFAHSHVCRRRRSAVRDAPHLSAESRVSRDLCTTLIPYSGLTARSWQEELSLCLPFSPLGWQCFPPSPLVSVTKRRNPDRTKPAKPSGAGGFAFARPVLSPHKEALRAPLLPKISGVRVPARCRQPLAPESAKARQRLTPSR